MLGQKTHFTPLLVYSSISPEFVDFVDKNSCRISPPFGENPVTRPKISVNCHVKIDKMGGLAYIAETWP